jgi:hypothetical protein
MALWKWLRKSLSIEQFKLSSYMKKAALVSITLCFLLSIIALLPAHSVSQVRVAVDGREVIFPDEPPYIDDDTDSTMVPIRMIAESLGAEVKWDAVLEQVTFRYKDLSIILAIDQHDAKVNGKDITLDAPAVIKNDRTMAPLRFISEGFGARVDWMEERELVLVTSSAKAQKGTWIWDSSMILSDQEDLLQFAINNRISVIYLHINRERVSQQAYQSFIRRAHDANIKVEALAGTPHWVFASHQVHIERFITWVAQYNASVAPEERFRGLHMDIEPYTLAEWHTDQQRILENWMDAIRFIEKKKKEADRSLTMAFDVPFWLYKIKVPGTDYSFSAWLLEKADCLVIMGYRDSSLGSNGIIALAKPILREASHLNKQAVVAVDTAPSSEGEHTTFYSLGTEVMEAELLTVMENLATYSGYAGLAIHDYRNWRELTRRSKGGVNP